MAVIHLIKKTGNGLSPLKTVPGQPNTYVSGYWSLSEKTAQSLVDGQIYFHERQDDPSFYGGKVISFEQITEGEYRNKIVFKFLFTPESRGIRTTKDGWSQEMKLIP